MSVVSFDFDGVLHQQVKVDRLTEDGRVLNYGPLDYTAWTTWSVHPLIVEKINEEISAGNTLVIVSAREQEFGEHAMKYLDKIGLTNKFATIRWHCKNKVAVLQELGAIRHYEDSLKHVLACREAGIEAIQVYPFSSLIFEEI